MAPRAGQDAAQMPFIKNLASSNREQRTSSLAALTVFLSSRRSLPDAEARKLWTGLYYALWMTDRPKPQQALVSDLASLLSPAALRPGCAAPWLRAFWHVLGAQWTSIEALRLDKFLLLVRRVFAAMVAYAMDGGGGGGGEGREKREEVVLDVCREYVFDGEGGAAGTGVLPLGLRLHVLDVWVDELAKAGVLGEEEGNRGARLAKEMRGMVEELRGNGVKVVRERAAESCEDERLPRWTRAGSMDEEAGEDDGEEEDEDGWGGIEN